MLLQRSLDDAATQALLALVKHDRLPGSHSTLPEQQNALLRSLRPAALRCRPDLLGGSALWHGNSEGNQVDSL